MPPCINATISILKNLKYNFQKMNWNFSKNSSDLVAGSFPNFAHNILKLRGDKIHPNHSCLYEGAGHIDINNIIDHKKMNDVTKCKIV